MAPSAFPRPQNVAIRMNRGATTELERVISATHDRWFDLEAITFDRDAKSLTIPFWGAPTMRYPRDESGNPKPCDRQLTIAGATSYRVADRELIGIYSFNTMEQVGEVLTIKADPYVTITVEGNEMSIAVTDMAGRAEPTV